VKRIGFLSFGHWSQPPSSHVRSASDALMQSLELAVAAEEIGADGAYYRVHHFARQLGSPFPLLAAALLIMRLPPDGRFATSLARSSATHEPSIELPRVGRAARGFR